VLLERMRRRRHARRACCTQPPRPSHSESAPRPRGRRSINRPACACRLRGATVVPGLVFAVVVLGGWGSGRGDTGSLTPDEPPSLLPSCRPALDPSVSVALGDGDDRDPWGHPSGSSWGQHIGRPDGALAEGGEGWSRSRPWPPGRAETPTMERAMIAEVFMSPTYDQAIKGVTDEYQDLSRSPRCTPTARARTELSHAGTGRGG
jgi:hypothetical protein